MKDFLENYGFAILSAIVVVLLIAMATPVGGLIKNQVMGIVDSFASRTESRLEHVDQGEAKIYAEEIEGGKCKLTILTVPSSTNEYKGRFSVNGNSWSEFEDFEKKEGSDSYAGATLISHAGASKQIIKYEVYDKGTNNLVDSGRIELKGNENSSENEGSDAYDGTDLTNTIWKFNDYVSVEGMGDVTYNINYSLTTTTDEVDENGTQLEIKQKIETSSAPGPHPPIPGFYSFYRICVNSENSSYYYNDFFSGVIFSGESASAVPKADGGLIVDEIHIDGGTDATNADLIAWLEANATLQS